MLEPWRKGRIVRIEDETSTTKRFWIEIPELVNFDFKPGQFVTLDLPIDEKKNRRWRSYSIASAPDGTNIFELVIVKADDGKGTSYLFNDVQAGAEVLLRGPQGVFILPENLDKEVFFICTGTGVAPFRSMIQYIFKNNIPHKNLYLVFGCRKFGDALYSQEFNQLQQQFASFKYLPVFSREQNAKGIHTGYVHAVYEQLLSTRKDAVFFLCGWKNMINEAKQNIIALGYDKHAIHLEIYG
ncbi:FAD-dependent oxidoreductase [Panacibacter sp. DH6]|uniref:FAD-dependent oxidoreductase n=1 Tax=Panacibacter microcysteis TaxID=2793269 RepID=A0A931E1H2_9BACT|nr:FAD-dependent oxidoreductase [Panacibacter microcysteis]MBG9375750.1 FAD-dependent oxidoreductase [Panacibacter microcysteis]